jgi:hypothetical protein
MSTGLGHSELDQLVRYHVYDHVMREGLPPTMTETSSVLSRTTDDVRASFQRLADGHIFVLQKIDGEILMANPFSAVPTSFLVKTESGSYYGNCIWDALGIPAILKQDATIEASCGCCSASMNLRVTNGLLQKANGIAHFGISAAHWWDDIVFN